MKVMKFGGGCLREADGFLAAAEIIGSEETAPAVVVSAAYGMTDRLVEAVREARCGEARIQEMVGRLRDDHLRLARDAIRDDTGRSEVIRDLSDRLCRLQRLLYGIAYTEELTEQAEAQALSYGERLSARLLAGVIVDRGGAAAARDSDEIGFVTDPVFRNATVRLTDATRNLEESLRPGLNRGQVPVITGFFGATADGRITTFGRNGTDYSAAAVARCLRAERLVIWKDTDGFMSADPGVVAEARRIPALSFSEAAELSYFGARILHPRTVEPLIGTGIPVEIRSLWAPSKPGSVLMPEGNESLEVIKGVACNRGVAVLRLEGPGVGCKPGIIAEAGRSLSRRGINILSILTAQTCINLLIDRKDAQSAMESLSPLKNGMIGRIGLMEEISLVAVVGEGLGRRPGLAARIFSAVARSGINVLMIASGATEAASYFIVEAAEDVAAVTAIHREFFG